jgi:hypothetical protein
MKVLEENRGGKHHNLCLDNNFWKWPQKHKSKNIQMGSYQTEKGFIQRKKKNNHQNKEKKPREW